MAPAAMIRGPAVLGATRTTPSANRGGAAAARLPAAGGRLGSAPGVTCMERKEFLGGKGLGASRLPARARGADSFAVRAAADGPLSKLEWKAEEERNAQRSVFTYEEWQRHRETSRYMRNLQNMVDSRIVKGVGPPVLGLSAIAGLACFIDQLRLDGVIDASVYKFFTIPALPFSLTGFSIGLLLVFRTNNAYGRWWEARKLWGLLLNRSRDLSRMSLGYMTAPEDAERQDKMVRYTMCVSKSLMCHLRTPDEHDVAEECAVVLKPDELALLTASAHRPNHVIQVMSELVNTSQLDSIERNRLDHNLTTFADVIGACERIYKTPIPLSYTRHTARALLLWLAFLPFGIVSQCHWGTIPVEAFTAFLLIGIEELGIEIEEPFSILPLEVIAKTAETNCLELQESYKGLGYSSVITDKLN